MTRRKPGELRTRRGPASSRSALKQLPEIGPLVVTGKHVQRPGLYTTSFDVSAAGPGEPLARELGHLWQARNNNGRATTAAAHRDALNKLLPVLRLHLGVFRYRLDRTNEWLGMPLPPQQREVLEDTARQLRAQLRTDGE